MGGNPVRRDGSWEKTRFRKGKRAEAWDPKDGNWEKKIREDGRKRSRMGYTGLHDAGKRGLDTMKKVGPGQFSNLGGEGWERVGPAPSSMTWILLG